MSQRWTVGIICVLLGIFTGISSGVIDKFLTSKNHNFLIFYLKIWGEKFAVISLLYSNLLLKAQVSKQETDTEMYSSVMRVTKSYSRYSFCVKAFP